jgi:hypothetical protein
VPLLQPAHLSPIRSSYDPKRPECPLCLSDRWSKLSIGRRESLVAGLALGVSADSGLSIESVLHRRSIWVELLSFAALG